MAAMESPGAFPESPTEQEDVVYPCKGCGEILEEGKAFELAGNRWHIDCFRCNTCGTLLDSDANLLLLGDGSLICNNCTYSCNACGNKIEDLAILTGDQAFCSGCFRCRNCKRKIENLRYARTSQGIFCMSCHESLMARRRKKARAPKPAAGTSDKALPSLPPGASHQPALTPDLETPLSGDSAGTPNTQPASPKERISSSRNGGSSGSYRRDVSPLSNDAHRGGPTLPASTYNEVRPTNASPSTDDEDDSERGFLPMAFDPTLVSAPSLTIPRKQVNRLQDASPPLQKENQAPDYFGNVNGRTLARSAMRNGVKEESGMGSGTTTSSRSVSTERDQDRVGFQTKSGSQTPYQEKARSRKQDSADALQMQVANGPEDTPKPRSASDVFALQEAPKSKKGVARPGSSKGLVSPIDTHFQDNVASKPTSPVSADSQNSVNPFDEPRHKAGQHPAAGSPAIPVPPPRSAERGLPARGDSLAAAAAAASRVQQATSDSLLQATSGHQRNKSSSSTTLQTIRAEPQRIRGSVDMLPPRSANRPSIVSKPVADDDFTTPRHAPAPPPIGARHRHNESISTLQSEDRPSIDGFVTPALHSAGLPKYSLDGGFSMDDEMGRILRGEQSQDGGQTSSPSVLRRVSNAVKHGRSFSDRAATTSIKSPRADSIEISSPSITSPTTADGLESLRNSLRRAQNHIAELESEKLSLQDKLEGSSEIKAVNNELNAKRNTMAFLDTQREMVVRELEIMTEHLSKAKDNTKPLDLVSLKTSILKDFAESLQKLKQSMSTEIEDLMHKRTELTEEIGNLIQMKDKGFQEYETLSTKNTQLVHHNNELLRSIQGVYQENRVAIGGDKTANGLGITQPAAKVETPGQAEMRNLNVVNTDPSLPTILHDTEAEPATVLTAPQVVNIRKGAKPNKFNWRRGGEKITGTLTKGIKGAFVNNEKGGPPYSIGMPYNQSHQAVGGSDGSSMHSMSKGSEHGLFPPKNGGITHLKNASSTNLGVGSDGSVLFGSELSARCAFEKLPVPSIVTHCITQVEARGIEVEGVYRKSGGAGQVKNVQAGFEKDGNFDITDDDLDIHAVTSCLKQYFRKLPTPLITYDVYDTLLEAGQLGPGGKDGGSKEKQIAALRAAVEELPEAHRVTLKTLIRHLSRVMACEPQNLMTPLNLAVVFAPTIMRPLSIEREMTDMQTQRTAVQALLEHHKAVFAEEGE